MTGKVQSHRFPGVISYVDMCQPKVSAAHSVAISARGWTLLDIYANVSPRNHNPRFRRKCPPNRSPVESHVRVAN